MEDRTSGQKEGGWEKKNTGIQRADTGVVGGADTEFGEQRKIES